MLFDFVFFKKENYSFLEVMLVGFFYSSISIFLSYLSFKEYASLFSVFLTTLSLIPFVVSRIKNDEFLDFKLKQSSRILLVHSDTLLLFMAMFMGISLSYMTWYTLVDFQLRPLLFEAQTNIVNKINGRFSNFFKSSIFIGILSNNLKVLSFVAIFGLLYGFGSLFILVWNASVLGYALGNYFLNLLNSGFAMALSRSFLRYFTHGLLEILAYFVASLASGIIFMALVRKDFRRANFNIILRDVIELFTIAIVILVVAAFIEVYITPFFY